MVLNKIVFKKKSVVMKYAFSLVHLDMIILNEQILRRCEITFKMSVKMGQLK